MEENRECWGENYYGGQQKERWGRRGTVLANHQVSALYVFN
jgi:hypothetical protein